MSEYVCTSSIPPADIGLMLRAHAELSCLRLEVIPVLRQIETRHGLPDDQLGAALAYLEVTWMEARRRAQETDAAHAALVAASGGRHPCERDGAVKSDACRYHGAVRSLRDATATRIGALLASPQREPSVAAASGERASPASAV